MPEFLNPFSGMQKERSLSPREITRAIRMALCAEEEAIHLYEALADAIDDPCIKAVFQDIADEERVHVGEFQKLLNILLPDEESCLAAGAQEVDELYRSVTSQGSPPAGRGELTVGQLNE